MERVINPTANHDKRTANDGVIIQIRLEDVRNGSPVYINLNPLDGLSAEEKASAIQACFTEAYEQSKQAFEEDGQYGKRVKNGTYPRCLTVIDTESVFSFEISLRVQRYKYEDGHTETFYGGIIMPRIPYVPCQVITLLAEREDYEKQMEEEKQPVQKGNKVPLSEFCEEWGIGVKTFHRCAAMARHCLSDGLYLRDVLLRFLDGDHEALSVFKGFAA